MEKLDEIAKKESVANKNFLPYYRLVIGDMMKKFFGKYELHFENGKITHCKKTESIKL
jgi:hypothetical protein